MRLRDINGDRDIGIERERWRETNGMESDRWIWREVWQQNETDAGIRAAPAKNGRLIKRWFVNVGGLEYLC
jgi:hypothetical protein